MDSGYIIGDFNPDMLRFNEKGGFYLGEGTHRYYFCEDDGGLFSQHITGTLGWGSLYYEMPDVAWNYILNGSTLKKLINEYNETMDPDNDNLCFHRMFTEAIDKIDENSLWYLIWEDFS